MRPVLWIALAASVGAAAWLALQPEADDASAVVPVARQRTAAAAAPPARPEVPRPGAPATPATPAAAALRARAADWPPASPTALLAWGAPPPPQPAAPRSAEAGTAAPAAPRAPAFPYQWIGMLDDGRGRQALLGGPVRSAAVRAGQVLDGQWRVERVRDAQLDLTWLPGGLALSVRSQAAASRPTPSDNPDDNPGPDS